MRIIEERRTLFFFLKSLILVLIAAIFLTLSFPELNFWFLSFASMGLLFLVLRANRCIFALLLGVVFGVLFFTPILFFISKNAGIHAMIFLAIIESLFIGCFAFLYSLTLKLIPAFRRSNFFSAFIFSLLWVIFEELRSTFPFDGFSWAKLGYMEVPFFLAKFSWLGGTQIVSFIIVFFGCLFGVLVANFGILRIGYSNCNSDGLTTVIPVVAIVLAVIICSPFIPADKQNSNDKLAFGAIQGNVIDPEKGEKSNFSSSYKKQLEETENLKNKINSNKKNIYLEAIFWSEQVDVAYPRNNNQSEKDFKKLAEEFNADFFVGMLDYNKKENYINNDYLAINKSRGVIAKHTKKHLVPFGEYIPNREILKNVLGDNYKEISKQIPMDMKPGTDSGVMKLSSNKKAGILTCFEVTDDKIVEEEIKQGAEFFVVPSGTRSFGYTNESLQLLEISRARAIQTNRYVIFVSDTGVSALVDPAGKITHKTTLFKQESFFDSIDLYQNISPAINNIFICFYSYFILFALLFVFGLLFGKRK